MTSFKTKKKAKKLERKFATTFLALKICQRDLRIFIYKIR